MKAVFSLWTRPLSVRVGAFGEFLRLEDFLASWALSVSLAHRHYGEVELVTDSAGKAMLCDALALPFSSVSTVLDDVPSETPTFHWALSKLVAYSMQDRPFVHIDSDVYLWQRLPERIERAPLFAQNAESLVWHVHYYRDALHAILGYLKWLPPCFGDNVRTRGVPGTAVNAGILGGNDVAFLRAYGMQALEMVLHPDNQIGWRNVAAFGQAQPMFPLNAMPVIVEQYLFHRAALWEGKWDDVEFLVDEREAFEDRECSAALCRRLGYTHLMSPQAKHDKTIVARVAGRLMQEFPQVSARVKSFRTQFGEHPLLGVYCAQPST